MKLYQGHKHSDQIRPQLYAIFSSEGELGLVSLDDISIVLNLMWPEATLKLKCSLCMLRCHFTTSLTLYLNSIEV